MSHPLFELLTKLEQAKIAYTLGRHRPDSILVSMTVVGERIEVDVFADGQMEVSKFTGNEDVLGGEELVELMIQQNTN